MSFEWRKEEDNAVSITNEIGKNLKNDISKPGHIQVNQKYMDHSTLHKALTCCRGIASLFVFWSSLASFAGAYINIAPFMRFSTPCLLSAGQLYCFAHTPTHTPLSTKTRWLKRRKLLLQALATWVVCLYFTEFSAPFSPVLISSLMFVSCFPFQNPHRRSAI